MIKEEGIGVVVVVEWEGIFKRQPGRVAFIARGNRLRSYKMLLLLSSLLGNVVAVVVVVVVVVGAQDEGVGRPMGTCGNDHTGFLTTLHH